MAEKIGFKTSLKAINPFKENEKVPVYFANFVLMDYGFGAVFGCPGHDQRDFDFAKKYNLNIKTVVRPKDQENFEVKTEAFPGEGIIINSEFLNGHSKILSLLLCLHREMLLFLPQNFLDL